MSDFAWVSWRAADGTPLMARDYPAAGGGGEARTPILCLHGLTRSSRDFEAVAPWIAGQGRRVLAADIRGRGRSGYAADPASYQPVTYAADMVALLDTLEIAQAIVIGTSMGGLVAMMLAAIAPPKLAGAVLNDVGPQLSAAGLARIASYAGEPPPVADWPAAAAYARTTNGAAFPAYGEQDWQAFARRLFREAGGAPTLDYDPRIMAPIREAAAAGGPQPDLWPLFDLLAAGGRPLLLVRGARSDVLEADGAAAMRARAPAMAYAEVANVGHAPMLTEPEAKAAIAGFLAKAP
ncbi:MAG: alpha/beta hydrolase fold protein [Phenylobacterium sp.]|nr:alpha/beta hydrolase fold protein [Phenylobacterium sp.]